MSEVFMVRHGPTHARCLVGWSDLPADLSDAAAIARLERFLPPDALIVSSDLSRAVTTADAVQGERVRHAHHPDLRELHFGAWELRDGQELAREDPERYAAFWERPGDVRPPGGESWRELSARVGTALEALLHIADGRPLVAVAHMGAIMTQLERAMSVPPEDIFQQPIEPLSVTRFEIRGDALDVIEINHRP